MRVAWPVPWIAPLSLRGRHVALVPLEAGHHDALVAAASDGALWTSFSANVPAPGEMAGAIAIRLAWQDAGSMVAFAVLAAGGHIVGMTSLGHLDPAARRLEIGWTWHAARVQRTALNTEAKLLLLGHAFNALGCIAVELRAHFLNQASRRAIERLGARLDGVLRHHQVARDRTLRDTCVYSITAPEWPGVRSHLRGQLEQRR